MLRQNDPVLHHVDRSFREYTMKMDDGRMGCKFCGTIFVKDTSITRIKFHLAALAASDGVRICGQVPQVVQDAALAAIDGPPETKLKTKVGSSNNEVTNAISASAQQQRNEMMMAHQQEDLSLEDWMASITIEDEELQVIGNFHERPSFNQADEPRGDPSQPTNDQLCSPSIKNDVIMNDAQNVAGVRTEPVVQVLEQSNAERDNLSMDAGRMQVGIQGMEQGGEEGRVCSHLDMENTGEGSTQHFDRIVPPTIDENYNRREATERLVQHGVSASSFGVYGNHTAILTSQQEQNNEVDNLTVDGARIQEPNIYAKSWEEIVQSLEMDDIENGIGGVAQPSAGASLSVGLVGNTNEINDDNVAGDAGTTPAAETMVHAPGRSLEEISRWLMEDDIDNGTGGIVQLGAGAWLENNDVIMNDVENMVRVRTGPVEEEENNSGRLEQAVAGASSFGGLEGNTNEIKGDALPTRKLVGQAFEDNKKTIWSLLMGDEVSSIGIYGMGGVGKTALVTHLYNQLLETPETPHVYWITASQDTSINRLQSSLARSIGLDLSNEDDELHRVVLLKKELMKKQHKWVLILDDLWKAFDLQKLGIQAERCKLILTTRSKKICQQMKTQHAIKVQPILEEEAWTLFIERLGHDITLSPKVKRIAVDVARECAGLPLGIITMAGSMSGVVYPHEWRNTLKKLKGSKSRDMEDEVFRLLRFSYDQLDHDSRLQQCLLYCALFLEDHCIEREELIGYLIDEGIIKRIGSIQARFDKGHTMLNKLEEVSLLESGETYTMRRGVKMHDLIRDMAIQILQENSQAMVKASAQLRELPDEKEWTNFFLRVSLMQNKITEILSNHSPRCPSLLALNLPSTNIKFLPDFICKLDSLTSLVLK